MPADYKAVRDLARKYMTKKPQLPGGASEMAAPPPVISGEWGYATCYTAEGETDLAPCVGGATGGCTVSLSQQGAFLARQWLVNAMQGIPISIWYDWSDANECTVDGNSSSAECYSVFRSALAPSPPDDPAAHGRPKPAYRAAVRMQKVVGPRPFVKREATAAPPEGQVVEPGDSSKGSRCLDITNGPAQHPSSSQQQDATLVYILAFGPPAVATEDEADGSDAVTIYPPAHAVPTARVEVLAVWTVSDEPTRP